MLALFVEHIMEVFMDGFLVYEGTFDLCLDNLTKVFHKCKEVNSVLNEKKGHFIVQEGVVFVMWFLRGVLRLIKQKLRGKLPWACGFLPACHQRFL